MDLVSKNDIKVSIVIPCYNQGKYIDETVESVLNQTFQDYEIIIVNDGSTDHYTDQVLKNYNKPKTRVVNIKNSGVSEARNVGIRESRGKYILPLDSDDKIASEYLEKAVKILEENKDIDIVYSKARLFGEAEGKWNLPEFSLDKFLFENLIFCSALFRKRDWEQAGGFNLNMKDGWEDYDFWFSMIEQGKKPYQIQEELFFYRITSGSRNHSINREMQIQLYKAMINNHKSFYLKNVDLIINHFLDMNSELNLLRALNKLDNSDLKVKIDGFIEQNKGKKVCFYGAGMFACKVMEKFNFTKLDVVGFLDGDSKKDGQKLLNYEILSSEKIKDLNPDIVILTVIEPVYMQKYIKHLKESYKLKFDIVSDLFSVESENL